MKIIHINASYKPAYIYGGPALSVSKLCEGLVRAGADVEVLTTTANGETELAIETAKLVEIDGVKVTYFKRLTKDHTHFSPGLLHALSKKLKVKSQKQFNPSTVQQSKYKNPPLPGELEGAIVHIHAWWNLVSVLACLVAKIRKVPIVLSPRGMLSSYAFKNRNSTIKKLIHRFIGLPLLRYCHFHVTSEQEKEDVLKQLKPKSITIIPNFLYLPPVSNSTTQQLNNLALTSPSPDPVNRLMFNNSKPLALISTLTSIGSGRKIRKKNGKLFKSTIYWYCPHTMRILLI